MHKVEFSCRAREAYRRLRRDDPRNCERVREALSLLAEDPGHGKPLKAELRGRWSYRAGSFRILYLINADRLVVIVLAIGHRGDVYH